MYRLFIILLLWATPVTSPLTAQDLAAPMPAKQEKETGQETPSDPLAVAKAAIAKQTQAFSNAYMADDIDGIMQTYTQTARIVPINSRIIAGWDNVRKFWASAIASPAPVLSHKFVSEDLVITGDMATDIGYYTGATRLSSGQEKPFGGAYMIVWKKEGGVWRRHMDMWNTIRDMHKKD